MAWCNGAGGVSVSPDLDPQVGEVASQRVLGQLAQEGRFLTLVKELELAKPA